jgi:hypothetical protein
MNAGAGGPGLPIRQRAPRAAGQDFGKDQGPPRYTRDGLTKSRLLLS